MALTALTINKIERIIGYNFKNHDLLNQAFIRKSYSMEKGGENNEVLEFIGDKALDLAVIKIMMDEYGEIAVGEKQKFFKTKLCEGNFTEMKKEVVEKKALSIAMDKLGLHKLLIMGQGDIKQNIQNEASVKEDLFEAILGAVTLDCDWNIDAISKVALNILDFGKILNYDSFENTNYVGLLQEWSQKHGYGLPDYYYRDIVSGEVTCTAKIKGTMHCEEGVGKSESDARMNASKNLYLEIKRSERITNKYIEAVGFPDESRALLQVNELVQKKLISKPEYEFEEYYDDFGNPLWSCSLNINELDMGFETCDCTSKNDAKRQACFDMLVFLVKHD